MDCKVIDELGHARETDDDGSVNRARDSDGP